MESSEAGAVQGVAVDGEGALHPEDQVEAPTSTYVVQERVDATVNEGEPAQVVWRDIAEVPVPLKTKRVTVIQQALHKAGRDPEKVGPIRVLDEDSAKAWGQEEVTPPPVKRWTQGG